MEVPEPRSKTNRIGFFVFTYQMTCIARDSIPCTKVKQTPTKAHPVTVSWQPARFNIIACGPDDYLNEGDTGRGTCPADAATPSSSTSTSASPSASTSATASASP